MLEEWVEQLCDGFIKDVLGRLDNLIEIWFVVFRNYKEEIGSILDEDANVVNEWEQLIET
jgi:hypothetical protein